MNTNMTWTNSIGGDESTVHRGNLIAKEMKSFQKNINIIGLLHVLQFS